MATKVNIPILLFLLATTTISSTNSYKILIYLPQFGHSHITYMGKIADALAEAGNDVLVLIPRVDAELHWSVGAKVAKTRIFGNFSAPEVIDPVNRQREIAWTTDGQSIFTAISMLTALSQLAYGSCKEQLEYPEIIEELKREKYDLGIGEFFNPCGFGLFELANISAHILTSSLLLVEGITDVMGVPNAVSYVPSTFSANTDRMTYIERVENLMSLVLCRFFFKTIMSRYITSLYRNKFGNDFIEIAEKMSQSSFMFVNSEEYLDYPRPISHRIIYIGGIGLIEPKPLDDTYSKIVDNAPDGVVLISFGSVAYSYQMPDAMKRAFLKSFEQFPKLTFIWKYEKEDDKFVQGYSNVHISKWIPQVDLLNHSKVLAFITHAGAGSISESIRYATPMICIPLFGDQPRNAKLAEYQNIAIALDKHNITVESVSEALREILSNKKYKNSVQRLSRMIQRKPMMPLERVVKYSEFAAEFGRIENLEPYGLHMGYIEYFLIDIIVPALLFILLIGYIFVKVSIRIVCCVVSKLMRTKKRKNE